jgi:hypothetical protein
MKNLYFITNFWLICRTSAVNFFYFIFFLLFAPRLDSGYASKTKNLASGACGYLQGITVYKYVFFLNYLFTSIGF